MFSLYSRSRLHSFGEIMQPWRFWWRSPDGTYSDWDFAARNLRSTPVAAQARRRRLQRLVHVPDPAPGPRAEIGLSLPLFIKWDDSEFGLRAKAAGYPTVTFPGAAVWHVPWTDKNDALDWQAYFHQRNRFVAALLHSPYPRGGRMVRESLNHQIAHLVSMQYSTVELRQLAMQDVLAGPDGLHGMLRDPARRGQRDPQQFTDAQLESDPDAFPPIRRAKPPRGGRDGSEVPSRVARLVSAGLRRCASCKPPRALSREFPEAEVAGHGRQVVPPGQPRLGDRVHERRHVGGALPS